MTYTLTHLGEGLRMLKHAFVRRTTGAPIYSGNAKKICEQIVADCWNGKFLQVSSGHFNQFYSRDFGWCTDALLALGKKKQMIATLRYALERFRKAGGIHVAITPAGKPFNFPNWYSPDSVAYLFRSIVKVGDKKLISEYRYFLKQEADRFYAEVIDPKTGLVKPKPFSAMKDHSIRKSSCYDTVMAAVLQEALRRLKIDNPILRFDYKKVLLDHYWTGEYFLDDLSGKKYIAADANLYPFYFGIFTSPGMIKKAFRHLQQSGLDDPFPLHYTKQTAHPSFILAEWLVPGWEASSIWPQMGLPYIEMMRRVNKKKASLLLDTYTQLIEQHKSFIEVYNSQGKPYKSLLYSADEGMLWASMYLHLIQ